MRSEIKSAYREFLAGDWAHRSYLRSDQVAAVKIILEQKGLSATEQEIESVISRTWNSVAMRIGFTLLAISLLIRGVPLPAGWSEFLVWIPAAAVFVLLGAVLANHLRKY